MWARDAESALRDVPDEDERRATLEVWSDDRWRPVREVRVSDGGMRVSERSGWPPGRVFP